MLQQRTLFELGRIQSPGDWLVALAVLATFLAAACYLYRRDSKELSLGLRLFLPTLRCLVLLIAFVIFLDPRLRIETDIEQPSRVVVLLDDSASMTIQDMAAKSPAAETTRLEVMKSLLDERNLLTPLRPVHELQIQSLGAERRNLANLPRANDPSKTNEPTDKRWIELLTGSQQESRIGDALASILGREDPSPLAGIVVLSDGNNNAGQPVDSAIHAAKQRKVPIAVIGLGNPETVSNLRLADMQAPSRVFRGDDIPVTTIIQAVGMAGKTATVTLSLSEVGTDKQVQLENKQVTLGEDQQPMAVEFGYLPEKTGSWRLTAKIASPTKELLESDNHLSTSFDVVDDKTRVLLFGGGPSRDYQFVRTLLHREESVETSVYLQSSPEAVAQDADHVLVEFPKSREELFEFDLIIGFDPNWGELQPETRELFSEWISRHAGGFITLTGPIYAPLLARNNSLQPILRVFPVVFKELFATELTASGTGGPWPVRLTAEGLSQDFMSLDDDKEVSQQRWTQFQGVFSAFPVLSIKSGATVLADLPGGNTGISGDLPAVFATQYYGAGKVLYVGTNELWRLRRLGEQYYDRLWIQWVRHFSQGRLLRGASRGSLILDADRFTLGNIVPIRARLLDAEFNPAKLPEVQASVSGERNTAPTQVRLLPDGMEGQFRGEFLPPIPGDYTIKMLIPNSDELVERRFQVSLPNLEFQSIRQNVELLSELASQTGGKLYKPDDVAGLADLFENRTEVSVLLGTPIPLWDRWYVLLAGVLLLSFEWLLRKLVYLA